MKTLMTTTALVVATALPVAAEMKAQSDKTVFAEYSAGSETSADMLASNLIGMRVYTSETDIDATYMSQIDGAWNDIGEVSDVVMSRDGQTQSILLDIGGFLGMGEKTVAVDMDELKFVADKDDAGDFFLVFTANREMLEEAESFNFDAVGDWASQTWQDAKSSAKETAQNVQETAGATMNTAKQKASDAAQATKEATAEARTDIDLIASNLTVPTIEREGFEVSNADDLTTEMLTGAPVYDTNDQWIGEVSELIINQDGTMEKAVLDVGGFLGIGEKPVATDMQSLTIKRETDGSELRVYVDATKEQLENMPAYDES